MGFATTVLSGQWEDGPLLHPLPVTFVTDLFPFIAMSCDGKKGAGFFAP
jgi:hypothetical protein